MAYRSNHNPFDEEDEDKFEDISDTSEIARAKQERDLYQQRMIDSSYRSLQLINESQGVASETGEELRKQREQLERTTKNLDKISGDLNQSDRSITSLKSVWGTVSTWFKKPINQGGYTSSESNDAKSNVTNANNEIRKDNAEIQNNLRKVNQKTDLSWDDGGYNSGRSKPGSTDDIVDKNLDQMLAGLDILKSQGLALGSEIDDHNVLLDKIQGKVDTADVRIENQTTKIRKILK